jgi:hypothetical protein
MTLVKKLEAYPLVMSTWQQPTHLHHHSLIRLLTQTCLHEFKSGLPTQNNPGIIKFFKKLAHPTPKKKNKNSRNFADIIKLQSPQATKRSFKIHLYKQISQEETFS